MVDLETIRGSLLSPQREIEDERKRLDGGELGAPCVRVRVLKPAAFLQRAAGNNWVRFIGEHRCTQAAGTLRLLFLPTRSLQTMKSTQPMASPQPMESKCQ